MMNKVGIFTRDNFVDILLIIMFLYPLVKGFLFKFSSRNLKSDIEDVSSYVAFIIGSILGICVTKKVFVTHSDGIYNKIHSYIPDKVIHILQSKPIYVYIVVMPIVIFIIYKLIEFIISLINLITLYPILDGIENFIKEKSSFAKRMLGLIFQIPKAICFILFTTLIFNLLAMVGISKDYNKKLQNSKVYTFLTKEVINPISNSHLAKELPRIINNSFKIVVKNDIKHTPGTLGKTIVYYNGITLNEGLKSNEEIDNFSKKLVKNKVSTREKAKGIYNWIGKNIEYDYDKVDNILRNDFTIKSGAINTFYTRKGICFDYSCLFSVMCRANGIKSRIVTGEGFNGSSWVNHAWNQVYIEEDNRWINVDTTFYKGGNYFDSSVFKLDHRNGKIAN